MLSIRSVTNEIDRLENQLRIVAEVNAQGIRSVAEYAVEIEPVSAREFRDHLRALQRRVVAARSTDEWRAVQASFRGELRAYKYQAASELERLRGEIQAAGEAVHQFAETVTVSGADHEAQLKENLDRLDVISRSGDLDGIRGGIRGITDSIFESIHVMQRNHQAAVAQLKDEIRVLHEQMDKARNAEWIDAATGFWNRKKLDARIAEFIAMDRLFCLLLARVRSLPQVMARYSEAAVRVCTKSLLQRFHGIAGREAVIGHWDESSFAAILEIPAPVARDLSRIVAQRLSGAYSVQQNGASQSISLVAVAGVVERLTGVDEATYQRRLRKMAEALASG